jgi:hypothetical protein
MIGTDLFKLIEQEKSIFKIITKTKNENFFIEKWIVHHLNILQDTKLIVFDNMSDDKYVNRIYRKYRNNIILFKFDMYMDSIHMARKFMQLYKSLSVSSKFFTIIDSDEYLYLYDGDRIINDNTIIKFLEENTDCNFFAPCWIENVADSEKLLSFNPQNLSYFHFGKPIINANIITAFELALNKYSYPILHHIKDLPIWTYGKTQTKFLLLHLKNLNKYQRIKANMQKLVAFKIIQNDKDFFTLLKIDPKEISGYIRNYIIETKALVENIIHADKQSSDLSNNGVIEICDDGMLKFTPDSYEQEFKNLMDSDYFDLIHFDPAKVDINQYTTINSYRLSV